MILALTINLMFMSKRITSKHLSNKSYRNSTKGAIFLRNTRITLSCIFF